MNERIRELMGNTLDEKFAGTWSTMDMQDLTKFAERFAELIVGECLDQIEQAIPDTTCASAGPYKTAKIAATNRVRKHFGVEE